MSVGNSSLTGIPKAQTPPPVTKVAPQGQQNQSAATARSAALANTNASTVAPAVATAVAVSGTGVAAPTGGTTAPAGRGPAVAAGGNQIVQTATAMAQAAMANPAVLAAMFGAAVNTTRTRAVKSSGDVKEDSGDVELETESEMQPDALQDSDQEQGAGEITQAGSTSGPST
ncbi:MAG: hypothetical protein A3B68_01060 [Candidatus Melainabacteria bacterium RIFCSPHIGHO2_02_FULL_34_12]|nr:MAG: hypothetical protein A3B68_01060 [Candidatus Melainabacteria bacterium RIFCSPHIGHO2_02_FULL_34_12]